MLRTLNTSLLAFLQSLGMCVFMVLFLPLGLHNKLLLSLVLVIPIWLVIALWVTQKNTMGRVSIIQSLSLVVMAILIGLELSYG